MFKKVVLRAKIFFMMFVAGIAGNDMVVLAAKKKKAKATPTPTPSYPTNPFDYVEKGTTLVTDNEQIRDTATSWNTLMVAISIICMVIVLVSLAAAYALSRHPEKLAEAKQKFMVKVVVFIAIIAFSFLFGQLVRIALAFML